MRAFCPKCGIEMELIGTHKTLAYCRNCDNLWTKETRIPDEMINPSRR